MWRSDFLFVNVRQAPFAPHGPRMSRKVIDAGTGIEGVEIIDLERRTPVSTVYQHE